MGCAGSSQGASGGETNSVAMNSADGPDKARTFRERRLSMSQKQEKGQEPRRLSVYGSNDSNKQPTMVVSPCSTCACKSIGGLEPVPGGSASKINQDRGLAIYPLKKDPTAALFGVYDGHGRCGEKVSEFVIQKMSVAVDSLLGSEPVGDKDPGKVLHEAYLQVDEDLFSDRTVDSSVSGTTAVTCIIKDEKMWLANSGDSRAIVVRKKRDEAQKLLPGLTAIDLTIDQKPDSPEEMRRILKMGGHVTPAGANGSPSRVWHNLRGLAMARSIGDHDAATVGVIAEPEITE